MLALLLTHQLWPSSGDVRGRGVCNVKEPPKCLFDFLLSIAAAVLPAPSSSIFFLAAADLRRAKGTVLEC